MGRISDPCASEECGEYTKTHASRIFSREWKKMVLGQHLQGGFREKEKFCQLVQQQQRFAPENHAQCMTVTGAWLWRQMTPVLFP